MMRSAKSGSLTRTMPCPIEPKIGLIIASPIPRTAATASAALSHTTVSGVGNPASCSSAVV